MSTAAKVRRISPSQLDLFHRCNRRWAFEHRAKLKEPFSGAAQAGTETHKILEESGPWDREWTAPDTGKTYPVGQMARLLQAQTPEGVVAREKRWEFELEGLPFVCITDFLSERVVGDYKTTSRIKNAKSKDKLLEDPQRLLNSAVVPTAEKTTWLYGAWDTMLVTARECDIDRAADKKRMHLRVLQPAETMLAVPDDVDPLSLKPNVSDCMLFPPHGCPHKSKCFPPGKLKPIVTNSKESNAAMNSLIEKLRAKSAAAGNEAVPPEEPKTVEVPVAPAVTPEPEPAPAAESAEPKKRGRKSKAAEPVLAVEANQAGELDAQPGPGPEPLAGSPAPAVLPSNYLIGTLYVDCLPLTHAFELATKFIATASETVANDMHVPHALLIDFSKGGPAIAAQLRADLSGRFIEHLYLESKSAEAKACLQVLQSVSHTVIKGVF